MKKSGTNKGKKSRKNQRKTVLALILIFAAALAGTGVLTAKYLRTNMGRSEMLSSGFHFSSNYLEETEKDAEYQVSDWGSNSVQIQLYNYEKENVALISDEAISYKVTASEGWTVEVKNGANTLEPDSEGEYLIEAGSQSSHLLVVTYPEKEEPTSPLEVTVTATAPYEKELKAKFELVGKKFPEYEIEDKGDYCLVTIYSNDYDNHIYVKWTDKYAPDNTNRLMSEWINGMSETNASIDLAAYTTYELIFVETKAVSFSKAKTSLTSADLTIEIGE